MRIEKKQSKNELGVDLVKIWAMFSVISLHFFLHLGYYYFKIESSEVILHTLARMLFYQCVPLFIMISGYLKRKTAFTVEHYIKLIPVVTTYLFCAIAVITYKIIRLKQRFKPIVWLRSVWTLSQPDYAWYVNLYISLFLIMPFISLAYNSLKTKKQKTWAMLIVIFVTMFATSINKIPLDNEYIANIGFVPDKFVNMWCLGYYVVGMYINEFKPKPNKLLVVVLLAVLLYAEAFINYATATENFYTGVNFTNEDCVNVPVAALIFLLIYDIDIKNNVIKKIAKIISSSSLIFMLLSWITDSVLYAKHIGECKGFSDLLPLYFRIIPLHFVVTTVISVIVMFILKFINGFIMAPLFKMCRKNKDNLSTEHDILNVQNTETEEIIAEKI